MTSAEASLLLDGAISETYDVEATATEHPVEEGADITDHIRPSLQRVMLDVVHSDYPGPSTAREDIPSRDFEADSESRSQRARATINQLILHGTEVTIETGSHYYESMLLLTASEAVRHDSGDGYHASITAREILRVSTDTIDAPSPRVERARATAAAGATDGDASEGGPIPSGPDHRSDAEVLFEETLPALGRALGLGGSS